MGRRALECDRDPCPRQHDCKTTTIDHGPQTGSFYPCLDPIIFNPTDFDADDWMQHATALGAQEICLTAHHEGGFALWPSNYTTYVRRSSNCSRCCCPLTPPPAAPRCSLSSSRLRGAAGTATCCASLRMLQTGGA